MADMDSTIEEHNSETVPQNESFAAKHRNRDDAEHREDVQFALLLAKEMDELPPGYFTSVPFVGTMVSMSLTVVSAYFGFAVPASVLTFINMDIGPSSDASLFSIVWTLCNAISLLITGRISDKFGRRNFVLAAGGIALIGGIVACTAKNMNTLIGANVIIGLASGVHSSQTLFTGELLPHRYKFLVVFMMLIPMIISTGLAAFIARSLVETRSWRWIYYIYIIILGTGWIIQILVYHPPTFEQLHGGKRSRRQEFKRIDHVGIFLLVAGLTLFILGVSWGGNPQPWTSARILGLLISGGLTLVTFVIYETYTPSPNPIIDVTLFKDFRGFVCLNIVSMAAGAMYIALSIIWPQQVFLVYGSPNQTWQTSAWTSTAVGWGIWGGIMLLFPFVSIVKYLRWQVLALLVFSLVFTAALSTVDRSQERQAIAFAFLTSFPIGFIETGTTLMVQLDAKDVDVGMVYSLLSGLRSISGAVFTAVFVAILNSKARSKVASYVSRTAIEGGLSPAVLEQLFEAIQSQSAEAFSKIPGMTEQIQLDISRTLQDAYADAFSYVYYAAAAVGAVAVIAAMCLKDYDKYMTGHTPKQVSGRDELKVHPEAGVAEKNSRGVSHKEVMEAT